MQQESPHGVPRTQPPPSHGTDPPGLSLESQTARRRGSDSSEREKLLGADVVQRKGDGWLSPAGASRVSVGPMVSKADLSGHS